MPRSSRDPRSYVKPAPLRILPQKGIIIQARSAVCYNPTVPTRDEVRKTNYKRRVVQMRQQGFHSPIHKPYQGIGDPFYLEPKRMILHALGQWDDSHEFESSSSSDSDDDGIQIATFVPVKTMTAANFVLRKSRRDLNTLNKELGQGRELIRNVRLGHGLFQLLKQDKYNKSTLRQRELLKKKKEQNDAWQPPKNDSSESEDETDEDLEDDVDLKSYMVNSEVFQDESVTMGSPTPQLQNVPGTSSEVTSEPKSKVAFHGLETALLSVPKSSGRSLKQSPRPGSRRRLPPSRPYTPQHSNIGVEGNFANDKNALFRQLCALYWILEAMNVEAPYIMESIVTSWNLKEIGGTKTHINKQQKEKLNETKWKSFTSHQTPRPNDVMSSTQSIAIRSSKKVHYADLSKRSHSIRRSSSFSKHHGDFDQASNSNQIHEQLYTGHKKLSARAMSSRTPRRISGHQRSSVVSVASNVSETSTIMPTGQNRKVDSAIPEDAELLSNVETSTTTEEEDTAATRGLFRFLDEFYDSMSPDKKNDDKKESSLEIATVRSDTSTAGQHSSAKRKAKSTSDTESIIVPFSLSKKLTPAEIAKALEMINRSTDDPRLHALSNPREKMNAAAMRADRIVRPKSTPAVLEYQASLPSAKKGALPFEMRQKFAEISEEKALLLHDALEAVDRQRLGLLRHKFVHMPSGGSSFYRALDKMRTKSVMEEDSKNKDKEKNAQTHQSWYLEIRNNLPTEIQQDWHFSKILDKLGKYGLLTESPFMKKQSTSAQPVPTPSLDSTSQRYSSYARVSQGYQTTTLKKVESSKQSCFKFLKVLSGLKDYEICCPDVKAAIEFCREKIVEMSVEEFEEWFQQQFPTLWRPQTAPPTVKKDKKSRARVPHSAPPAVKA